VVSPWVSRKTTVQDHLRRKYGMGVGMNDKIVRKKVSTAGACIVARHREQAQGRMQVYALIGLAVAF
jgi:hypothetical protein